MIAQDETVAGIPQRAADLTPEFLTRALVPHGLGANVVESCRADALVTDQGIAADLSRVQVRYRDEAPHLPDSLIAKLAPADPAIRAMLHGMGFFERETRFYAELAARTPVPTPTCFVSAHDDQSGATLLLLEDLATARNGSTVQGCSLDEVTSVLRALARLHAAWWQSVDHDTQRWLRLKLMLSPGEMATAFTLGWPTFLTKLSIPVTAEILEAGDWITRELPRTTADLFDTGPRTLIHNDVQADNLFFVDDVDGGVVFADWQMVTYARGVIDVASLIRGHLDPDLRRTVEPDLVRLYYDALTAAGVRDYPLDRCLADYDLATVLAPARLATAVGHHSGLQPHHGAFWDILFLRYTR